jgi:hypothetical protein
MPSFPTDSPVIENQRVSKIANSSSPVEPLNATEIKANAMAIVVGVVERIKGSELLLLS